MLGCLAFGSAYFMKVPAAKALSELEQFRVARAALHDQLATFGLAAIEQHEGSEPLPEQDHKEFPKQDEHAPAAQMAS